MPPQYAQCYFARVSFYVCWISDPILRAMDIQSFLFHTFRAFMQKGVIHNCLFVSPWWSELQHKQTYNPYNLKCFQNCCPAAQCKTEINHYDIQFACLNAVLTCQMTFIMMTAFIFDLRHSISYNPHPCLPSHIHLYIYLPLRRYRIRVEGLLKTLSVFLSVRLSVCLSVHVRNSRNVERKHNKIWQHVTLLEIVERFKFRWNRKIKRKIYIKSFDSSVGYSQPTRLPKRTKKKSGFCLYCIEKRYILFFQYFYIKVGIKSIIIYCYYRQFYSISSNRAKIKHNLL
jgi:hypothetical protein